MGSMVQNKILVVDDSPVVLRVIHKILTIKGFQVFSTSSAIEAISILDKEKIDLVITDLKMPKVSGLDLIRYIKENFQDTEVMMITGYPSIESAIEALKTGAEEYLAKPFTGEELYDAVKRLLYKLHMRKREIIDKQKLDFSHFGLLGKSPEILRAFDKIKKFALDNKPVHISGENGTGKELVARVIHYHSLHALNPFITVNCPAIPEEHFETELRGYFELAFRTSEIKRTNLKNAYVITLFIDKICSLSPALQDVFLNVLENYDHKENSGAERQGIGFKLISSSSRNLLDLVKRRLFLDELYFKLSYNTISLPPLRSRGDDIPLLINYFAEKTARNFKKQTPQFSNDVLIFLKNYQWPGNIEELKSIVEFLVLSTDDPKIDMLFFTSQLNLIVHSAEEIDLTRTLNDIEVEYIKKVLKNVRGNKTRAAEILDVDRKTLRKKLLESKEEI